MDKSIRFLLVLPFFYPHRGGSQKYAEELLSAVMKTHKNVQVDVLCYNTDNVAKFETYRNFNVYRVSCWNLIPTRFALPNPIELFFTLLKLSSNKYNFVNTHIRFFDPTWWLWIYAKLIGARSILTEHVATHPVHQSKIVETIAKIVDNTIVSVCIKRFDYITFTNKAAQSVITERYHLKSPTYLFYGGVDTEFFKPVDKLSDRIIPKLNVAVGSDTVIITFLGRLIWTKGVTYLYGAIKPLLESTNKKLLFVFAGPGELEVQLKKLVSKDGLSEQVVMTGNLSYEQTRDLLSVSNIFINPSHHNEGFPNTILEAGASGAFIIASDNAGTSEVINSSTGILIPQKDTQAIIKSLSWGITNPDEATKISHNFREILVQNFDWKIIAKDFYNFLQEKL